MVFVCDFCLWKGPKEALHMVSNSGGLFVCEACIQSSNIHRHDLITRINHNLMVRKAKTLKETDGESNQSRAYRQNEAERHPACRVFARHFDGRGMGWRVPININKVRSQSQDRQGRLHPCPTRMGKARLEKASIRLSYVQGQGTTPMTTIYLSSAYEDLKDHRAAVFHALRRSGYQVIAMEDFVARDDRPLNACLTDVDVGRTDIYVGLFAFRYGYIPPREQGNPDGRSITELEFRRAEASPNTPCLVFLLDEKAPWPNEFGDGWSGDGEKGGSGFGGCATNCPGKRWRASSPGLTREFQSSPSLPCR
jgi:hypothetical protein